MEILLKILRLKRLIKLFFFLLTKKYLSYWIKPTFIGKNQVKENSEKGNVVCYALLYESLADLMILDIACEDFSLPSPLFSLGAQEKENNFFFIRKSEGFFGRKTVLRIPPKILRIIDQQNLSSSLETKIIPVSFFWGHQPDRENSIRKLVFSDNWRRTSQAKRIIASLFYRKHIYMEFGPALNIRDIISNQSSRSKKARKILRLLRTQFKNQRRAIVGPDLSNRDRLIKTVLGSKKVEEAILREASYLDTTTFKAKTKAKQYANEIFADQSYRTIRFFDALLGWLWNHLYQGIEYRNIELVKEIAETHAIIYVPCHRSHIDYLLLSYVLYHNGLTPPHIAAGKNLNLPVIGNLLRKGGAFFMRRSFQNDTLYKTIFEEYLRQLLKKGYSVEYFIEGTRSRTGRILKPKTGMLRMTTQSFLEHSVRNIAFVPVYFGYERILEARTYNDERKGTQKIPESFADIFKIFRSFKNNFGTVRVNFSRPIELSSYMLSESAKEDSVEDLQPDHLAKKISESLSQELACKINESMVIGPTNLLATACLFSQESELDKSTLLPLIGFLKDIALTSAPSQAQLVEKNESTILRNAADIFGIKEIKSKNIFDVTEDDKISMTYYANNTLPVFILPSLILNFIGSKKKCTLEELENFLSVIFLLAQMEYFLPWQKDDIQKISEKIVRTLETKEIIQFENNRLISLKNELGTQAGAPELARISKNFLCGIYIAMAFLIKENSSVKDFKKLINDLMEDENPLIENISPLDKINDLRFSELFHNIEQVYLFGEKSDNQQAIYQLFETSKIIVNQDFKNSVEKRITHLFGP